jgi:asparagine synthase (glutamine-hydrolysing)
MSGLAVLHQTDGAPADGSIVERMLAVIPYRAVDGSGVWAHGPIAIGHAKLRTTPEASAENSPFIDEAAGLVLSMDGRVDNRDELIAELAGRGHRIRSGTDAEIVLRAWQCWGTAAPAKLIGDFAFALWDRATRALFCAGDPLGVKSLYYFEGPGFFLCASELHQLFQDPRVVKRPNEAAIAEILVSMSLDRRETLFEGIRRLAPAHYLHIETRGSRGAQCHRYYDLDPSREIVYRDDDEYAAHFLTLLREAVRCRLRSPKGVASDLSGGVDSSSIVCLAEKLRHDGAAQVPAFESFSVRFEDGPAAEGQYVEEVLRKYPHRHTDVPPGIAPAGELIRQAAHYLDLPDYPNLVCADYSPLLGRRDDLGVRLTGLGGDEWLGGTFLVYADLIRQLRVGAVFERLRIDRNPPGGFAPFPGFGYVLVHYGLWPLAPESLKSVIKRWLRPPKLPAPVAPAFAAKTRLLERLSARRSWPRCRSFAQQALYQCYSSDALAYALRGDARWTAHFRLEGRHPFLDRRIMEFAFAIPDEQRCRRDMSKFVLREAMRGILPERVRLRRDKADLTAIYAMAIGALGGERLFDHLSVADNGWVDGEVVRKMYRSMADALSRGDPSYMNNIVELWMVIVIELWFNVVFLGLREPLGHTARAENAAV